MRRLRFIAGFGSLAVLAGISGCGERGPDKAAVHGMVTLDDVPVESGSISFIPTGSTTGPTAGAPIEKGAFRTLEGKWPVLGSHRVEITAYRTGKSVEVAGAGGATSGPSGPSTTQTMEMYIPDKYNRNSELKLDVKAGENKQDFPLKSK